jgi:hypothetical protein
MTNIFRLVGEENFEMEVAGEASYQPALKEICGDHGEDGVDIIVEACIAPEPTNSYDKNAVMVTVSGKKVGYLPRADAKDFKKVMRIFNLSDNSQFILKANIRGGFLNKEKVKAHYGIWLDFPEDESAAQQFSTFTKNVSKKKSCCLFPFIKTN